MNNTIERRLKKMKIRSISNKSGKGNGMWLGIFGVAVLVLLVAAVFGIYKNQAAPEPDVDGDDGNGQDVSACATKCPDTLTFAAVVNMENPLNQTGTETYDTTMYFFNTDGSLKTSSADSTAGASTLECGRTYTIQTISTSGAAGDSALIKAAPTGASVSADGTVTMTACGAGETWTFRANQHGLPEVRAKDIVGDGFMFDTLDASATDYESTDGAIFGGTTNNVTGVTVDSGGELHVMEYVRATADDQDVNDLGILVLVDMPTSVWGTPTVKIDGNAVSDVTASLSDQERIAYSDYEYAYLIPSGRIVSQAKEIAVDFSVFALSGQNPTGAHNVSIDYSPRGRYASTQQTNVLKVGAVDDSTSRTQIHTLHDTVIWVA